MPDLLTLDTNIAIYAFSKDAKAEIAREILSVSNFVSVQLLNEYANTAIRKRRLSWPEINADLAVILRTVPIIRTLNLDANREAARLAERYRLSFYDALMLAVSIAGGARTIYSEDMQHDLLVDGTLRIIDPFR